MNSIAAAQVPPAGSVSVDHVAHFVPDIDAAGAALEQLGFTATPFSVQAHRLQPDGPLMPAGTGNRCVMFEHGYLEILTPTGDTPMADQLRAALSRYVGVHMLAFGTGAPAHDHARLVAEGRIQLCQHLTPHLLWQPRWVGHRNGVSALLDVLLCIADPAEAAVRYSRYIGLPATRTNDVRRIGTARSAVIFADAQLMERALGARAPALPWIAGYVLETGDIARTRALFAAAGCEMRSLAEDRFAAHLPPALGGIAIVQAVGSGPFSL